MPDEIVDVFADIRARQGFADAVQWNRAESLIVRTYVAVSSVVLAVWSVTGCHPSRPEPVAAQPELTTSAAVAAVDARAVQPMPAVGAVFLGATETHTCSGGVVHSTTGDLIITAAHCLAEGYPAEFVAGFSGQSDPDQIWTIDTVYLDPRWMAAQDPLADYAFARVSRPAGGSLEAVTDSALALGTSPKGAPVVNVVGYAMGVGGGPIGCEASLGRGRQDYPMLKCGGMVNGTSGAPLMMGRTVVGVIGGLESGGCEDAVSYSAPFDDKTAALLARAEAGGPGDAPPTTFESDC